MSSLISNGLYFRQKGVMKVTEGVIQAEVLQDFIVAKLLGLFSFLFPDYENRDRARSRNALHDNNVTTKYCNSSQLPLHHMYQICAKYEEDVSQLR